MSASVRQTIFTQFEQAAKDQNRKLTELSDNLPLMDTGLDSLCFAIVVARLEEELGVDPFSATDARFPVTVGEFIHFYEQAKQQ
jgi:acyl carrier protein